MTRFKRIVFTAEDAGLLRDVQNCVGKWSTQLDPIKKLRTRLIELQNHRCVYCQGPIESEESGYREMEHILPKAASRNCSQRKGKSNDADKRRSTLGYPEFQFHPTNIAVSCKACNTRKGMHDALRNRNQARPLGAYPTAADLIWFHPQYDSYDQHITIDGEFVFTGYTDGGRAVIVECGLDQSVVLEQKFLARAVSRAAHSTSFRHKLETLGDGVKTLYWSRTHAAKTLAKGSPISQQQAALLLTRYLTAQTALELEAIYQTCHQYEKPT